MSVSADKPIIYLITKGEATASNFSQKRRELIDILKLAVEEEVSLVQLREKNLPVRLLFELTQEAAAITRGSATCLLVNDRADIAIAAIADGVHLTANSLSASVIRGHFPKDLIIGVSTHTLEEAINASAGGADFVVFGPVFETDGKGKPLGIAALAEVCETLRPFPVLALGGIVESSVSSILEAGAAGFAAIRALNDPDSLRLICRKLEK